MESKKKKIVSISVDSETKDICERLNKYLGSKKSIILSRYLKKGGLK